MKKLKIGDTEFDIPAIARGEVIPPLAEIPFEDSAAGRQLHELQQIHQELNKARADQAAYQASAKHREKVAERRGFIKGFLSSLTASILAGLVVYYWPKISGWVIALFH